MINPYSCYALSFGCGLLLYLFGYSELYPALSTPLLAFIFVSCVVFLIIGFLLFKKKWTVRFTPIQSSSFYPVLITGGIFILWTAEFIYEGGVPIIKMILKEPYNYRMFGIPSLHVFVVTFSSFYTVFLFHLFISSRKRIFFLLCVLNLIPALLIFNRGMFVLNLASCFFVLIISMKQIPRIVFIATPFILAALLYFFGVLGTIRVSREANTPYNNGHFLAIGQASQSFRSSIIPDEFFWSYIYISSPIANLQENINQQKSKPASMADFFHMMNDEVLMDFISKRISPVFNLQPPSDFRIPGPFNVSTVFSRPFSYLGWLGILIMAIVLILIPLGYTILVPTGSPFYLTGFAILCMMYLFLAFDNTIRFTGISFQLAYPIILHFVIQLFPSAKKYFVNNKVTDDTRETASV
jgi:hypothetical protein